MEPNLLNRRRTREKGLVIADGTLFKARNPSSKLMNGLHVLVPETRGNAVEATEQTEAVSNLFQCLGISRDL